VSAKEFTPQTSREKHGAKYLSSENLRGKHVSQRKTSQKFRRKMEQSNSPQKI